MKVRYRRRYSLPLLKLIDRANQHLRDRKAARPPGRLEQAISYTLNQWEEVLTYIDHGQVEIDNNGSERDVRPVASVVRIICLLVVLKREIVVPFSTACSSAPVITEWIRKNIFATSCNDFLGMAAMRQPCAHFSPRTGPPRIRESKRI